MKKKCFKKTVSWALSIVMSATMAVTPVLADTFTDGSQLIVSEDAGEETPAAAISDAEDEGMMEPEHTFEIEDNCEDSGRTGFSSENEASGFSDDSVLAAQTEEKAAVYLNPSSGNDGNTGESATSAVNTLSKAVELAQGGDIFLLDRVEVDSDIKLSNVTFRPGKSNMSGMLYISRGKVTLLVVLDKIKYKETSTKYAILFVGNTTKGGIIMLKFQDNNTIVIATFEDFILTAYVIIDELYHQFAPPEVTRRRHILNAKLSDSEIITISLCGELAGVDSENAWFSFVKRNYRHLFPQLCSRSRFNRTRRALMQTTELLRQKMISVFPIPVSSYYIVDSFPLAVCKFGRARYCKAFRGHGADYGKCPSKKETYYGYKVHALITLEGYIASFEITPASTDDREGLRDLADHWSNVTILADKGYVGKNMKQEMQEKNICLFALKRSNSKENWPKSVRQLIFKLRRRVEIVFSQLSGQLNAERVLAKSFQGLCTRLVNKVLAYNLCIALNSIFGETCELGKIKKLIF